MMPWEKYGTTQAKPWERYKSQPTQIINPTDDMSMSQRVAAGAGSAVVDAGLGTKQALTEYGNKKTLGQVLSPQQQMTLLARGDNLNRKLIPDQAVADIQAKVDEKRKIDAPLMDTGSGKTGAILGNIAMTLPALAIPGANTFAGSTLMGGATGLVQPTAKGESRALNTALGASAGATGYGLGKGFGKVSKSASNKIAKIEEGMTAKAAAEAASETASAKSAAGNAAQNAYRQLEHLRELGAKGALSPEQLQVVSQLEKELAEKAAEKLMPAAALKESTAKSYKEAIETEAERAAKIAAEKLSGREAKSQVMARVKRYGPGVVGGLLGNMMFPGLGGYMGGAAAGLVLRPTILSMKNLAKNPAVQRQALLPVANSTMMNNQNLPLALALMGSSIYSGQQ